MAGAAPLLSAAWHHDALALPRPSMALINKPIVSPEMASSLHTCVQREAAVPIFCIVGTPVVVDVRRGLCKQRASRADRWSSGQGLNERYQTRRINTRSLLLDTCALGNGECLERKHPAAY